MIENFSRQRKGITPVIAIVLLLMMTVAAAGAAFAWIMQIQGDITERVEREILTSVEAVSVVCYSNTDQLEISLINSGRAPIDMVPVTIFAREGGSTLALKGVNLEADKISDVSSWKKAQKSGGFTDKVNFTLDSSFVQGEYYSLEIRFLNSDFELPLDCIAR